MSKSRTPTPTSNLAATTTNITPPASSTTSRPHIRDENTSHQTPVEREEPLASSSTRHPLFRPTPSPESSTSRRRSGGLIRLAEGVLEEEPMAKRIRRESIERQERPVSRSSPSSDSQDGMADTETEFGKSQRTMDTAPPAATPPKKKRTRTLTTPHQSAVLHALLAQSRFPTTAMREEVGRSIGLSARKVQIWFQNQRQKARRPRSQGDAGGNRPPQYGPFPSTPESVSVGSFPLAGGMPMMNINRSNLTVSHRHDYEESRASRFRHSPHSSIEIHAESSVEDTPRLLGPGMPGATLYSRPSIRGRRSGGDFPTSAPPSELYFVPGPESYGGSSRVYTSPRIRPLPTLRPATSQPSSWRERDFSRTLPPLVPSRPATSSSVNMRRSLPSGAYAPYPVMSMSMTRRSISPEVRFAHHPPDTPTTLPPMTIPPPYALHPLPHWDEPPFSALARPSSSGWSRPGSSSVGLRPSSSPVVRRGPGAGETSESLRPIMSGAERTSHSPSTPHRPARPTSPAVITRPGRYDPVRATFIPFARPTLSPVASPPQPDNQDDPEQPGEDH